MSSDSGSTSYRTPKHAGESVLRFSIDEPGTYAFGGEYSDSSMGPEIVLAVAKDSDLLWILRGGGIIAGSVIIFWIGLFILI